LVGRQVDHQQIDTTTINSQTETRLHSLPTVENQPAEAGTRLRLELDQLAETVNQLAQAGTRLIDSREIISIRIGPAMPRPAELFLAHAGRIRDGIESLLPLVRHFESTSYSRPLCLAV